MLLLYSCEGWVVKPLKSNKNGQKTPPGTIRIKEDNEMPPTHSRGDGISFYTVLQVSFSGFAAVRGCARRGQ